MVESMRVPEPGALDILLRTFRSLGLDREEDQRALAGLIRYEHHVGPGQEITGRDAGQSIAALLTGVACSCKELEDGNRLIYMFHHPGDLCGLHRFGSLEPDRDVTIVALSECLVGVIHCRDIDRALLQHHSKLGLVIWRAAMLEASILRERMVNLGRRSALERVAHLLCEQLARRAASDPDSSIVALTQVDLADAAGLSGDHTNRVFQELRKLGVLSENGGAIEITDWKRLVDIAKFDARYLNFPAVLSGWDVHIE
jgi:CRP-like cAMP-binding protein